MPTELQPSRNDPSDSDPRTAHTHLALYSSKSTTLVAVLLAAALGSVSCRSERSSNAADGTALDRVAWLGSAEGWGLLGLPLDGGPLTYLSAENMESPTWAPPELGPLTAAWPGEGTIWVQFQDLRIGRYDYATGHLLSFDSLDTRAVTAIAPKGGPGLIVAPDQRTVELVAELEPWQARLGGDLITMRSASDGWVIAVIEGDTVTSLVAMKPHEEESLVRLQTNGVRDLAATPWGSVLYYLSDGQDDLAVHGLSLPELEAVQEIVLPEPGRALAVTPSGHRLYTAVGQRLSVHDRLLDRAREDVELPGAASELRFSINGANLLARLAGDQVAVLQVGVDSVLGIIPAEWDDNLPVALPGGRLVARMSGELVLYDSSRLVEIARVAADERMTWLAVQWQPPRPRLELARRTAARRAQTRAEPESGDGAGQPEEVDPGAGAPPGFYAVVSAARQLPGVENLVVWLRSVGYPGVVDRHRDVMGVTWYRAMVGPYSSRERADASAQELGARYGYKPWILHMESPVEPLDQPDDEGTVSDMAETEADTLQGDDREQGG